nr:hypothetical protein GCM10025730_35480 [Promicromonospora thailandica]
MGDELAGERAAVLHGTQHVAEHRGVLLGGREALEERLPGGRDPDVLALEAADRGQQVLVALGPEAVLRAEVVHHEPGADPGVGRDGPDRGTEALHREPVDRRVPDPGAGGAVGGLGLRFD